MLPKIFIPIFNFVLIFNFVPIFNSVPIVNFVPIFNSIPIFHFFSEFFPFFNFVLSSILTKNISRGRLKIFLSCMTWIFNFSICNWNSKNHHWLNGIKEILFGWLEEEGSSLQFFYCGEMHEIMRCKFSGARLTTTRGEESEEENWSGFGTFLIRFLP